jgi:hypothetical protein
MSITVTSAPADESAGSPAHLRQHTNALLAGGLVAGPLFIATATVQGLLREGFDISRHPFSALSVGDFGWVQIANFVVTGLLVIAGSTGLRRVLPATRRARRGTSGLVAAGVFVTDAADGFPVGTPEGLPDTYSWHAMAHGVVTPLAFLAIVAACFVLAGPLAERYGCGWGRASRLVPVGVVLVMAAPGLGGISLRLAVATALVLGWLAAVSRNAAARVDLGSGRSA